MYRNLKKGFRWFNLSRKLGMNHRSSPEYVRQVLLRLKLTQGYFEFPDPELMLHFFLTRPNKVSILFGVT